MPQKRSNPGAGDAEVLDHLAGRLDASERTQNRRAMHCSAPPSASAISERKHQRGETADDFPPMPLEVVR